MRIPLPRGVVTLLQGHLEDFAHESRLRVSPLVLARLMSNLYPARLEEWAHAKAQGGFFVEQHVVRTLIEAGKTPDPEEQKLRMQIAAEEEQRAVQREAQVSSVCIQRGDHSLTLDSRRRGLWTAGRSFPAT